MTFGRSSRWVGAPLVLLMLWTAGVASAMPARQGDWRQPRFDSGRSGSNSAETTLSPFRARHLRRIWKFETPQPVVGAPSVVGHRIFLASQTMHETGAVRSLDVSNGRSIWSRDLPCPIGPLTMVQGVLVTGDDCLDATDASTIVGLRPFDGRTLWSADGIADSSAVQHRSLFGVVPRQTDFGEDGAVVRYDPSTGERIWSFGGHRAGHDFFGTAIVHRRVYVTGRYDTLYELGARSGKLHWSLSDAGTTAPIIVDGVAYVSDLQQLRAIDLSSRTVRWTVPISAAAQIAVADGRVFVNEQSGLEAFDASSGQLLWNRARRSPYTGVSVADGVVYADRRAGGRPVVGVFAATTGAVLHHPVPGYGAIVSSGRVFVWGSEGIRAYTCGACAARG